VYASWHSTAPCDVISASQECLSLAQRSVQLQQHCVTTGHFYCCFAEWMAVPMDCCACWFDDSTYLKEALSLTPTYLRGTGNMFDYKDWQIPLGR